MQPDETKTERESPEILPGRRSGPAEPAPTTEDPTDRQTGREASMDAYEGVVPPQFGEDPGTP